VREVPQRVREGVVDLEVPQHEEGKPKIGEKNIWRNGVDSVVSRVGGVSVNNPE